MVSWLGPGPEAPGPPGPRSPALQESVEDLSESSSCRASNSELYDAVAELVAGWSVPVAFRMPTRVYDRHAYAVQAEARSRQRHCGGKQAIVTGMVVRCLESSNHERRLSSCA